MPYYSGCLLSRCQWCRTPQRRTRCPGTKGASLATSVANEKTRGTTGIHHTTSAKLPQPQCADCKTLFTEFEGCRSRHPTNDTETNDWQILRCQTGNRAFVHFVRPDRGRPQLLSQLLRVWGSGPSNILRRHRCARHCRCSIAMGRELKTLQHAGHCSSLTKSLANALCPWARALSGLSCHLTREDADTLMRAFGAQQCTRW